MNETLLPCPFCGQAATQKMRSQGCDHGHDPMDFLYIGCASCDVWLSTSNYPGYITAAQKDELAARWNKRVAGAQQPGAWVPLPGTLPDPGKPVLLDIGGEYPIRAMWVAKHTLEVGVEDDSGFGEYSEAVDTYYCPEGWYEWNEREDTHWRVDKTPVAWCELPPKEQK